MKGKTIIITILTGFIFLSAHKPVHFPDYLGGNLVRLNAVEMEDGNGAQVKRIFYAPNMKPYDPFVLLDEFFVTPPAGFPMHAHRGFEAITYMIEGGFRHTDNIGNDKSVYSGGIQRFTAGRGIQHAEYPATRGMNHGFQLWINLEKGKKGIPPSYQQVDAHLLPEKREEGMLTISIAGDGSPLKLRTKILYRDVVLSENYEYPINIPKGWNGFVYVFKGQLEMNDHVIKTGQALLFKSSDKFNATTSDQVRFLLIAGSPHNQPIKLNGAFID